MWNYLVDDAVEQGIIGDEAALAWKNTMMLHKGRILLEFANRHRVEPDEVAEQE